MSEEVLAAAAVYMFSTYNNYLNVLLNTQNKCMPKYTVIKHKEISKKYRLIAANRNRSRKNMNRQLLQLLAEPSGEFWSYVPISTSDFDCLLKKISQNSEGQDNRWKGTIPLKLKLALTLRYLTTGDSYENLQSIFKITTSIISRIIPEACSAINDVLKDMIEIPKCEDWLTKTEGFKFPHCLGVLDGKHVIISPPCHARIGDDYKRCFSIVVLTLVDSDYCFISADVGPRDRINGDDELNQTILWQKIARNRLHLPTDKCPPESETSLPYVFLGDEAFPLSKHVMIPFSDDHALGTPESAFNQQLKLSRVVVENAFGILSTVFRVLKNPIPLDAEKSSVITLSCILLHNFLRKSKTSRDIYSPPGSVDVYTNNELVSLGTWRNNNQNSFIQFQPLSRRTEDESAFQTRLDFMNYLFGNIKIEH